MLRLETNVRMPSKLDEIAVPHSRNKGAVQSYHKGYDKASNCKTVPMDIKGVRA